VTDLLQFGWFSSSTSILLPWKIDCDALSDNDIEALARLIRGKFVFGNVIGIPSGGLRLQQALTPYSEPGNATLIVDDVLTTGTPMKVQKTKVHGPVFGVVIFARAPCPDWVWPIFTVNDWAQSRGTGLG